ncbi:MAG: hypothetical protein ACQERF_09155, partial [Actinomycetota bacterium]
TGEKVPSNWDVAGRVTGWSDRRLVLPALAAIATGAAWWGTRSDTSEEDRIVRQALATSAASTTTAIAVLITWTARRPEEAHPEMVLVILAPWVVTAAMLIAPVRAGLHAMSAESSVPQAPIPQAPNTQKEQS